MVSIKYWNDSSASASSGQKDSITAKMQLTIICARTHESLRVTKGMGGIARRDHTMSSVIADAKAWLEQMSWRLDRSGPEKLETSTARMRLAIVCEQGWDGRALRIIGSYTD